MAMGLKTASAVFQRFINKIFDDLVKKNQVIVFMDDIMIVSKVVNEHFQILKEVFLRLAKNKLELRMDKCEFLQQSIKYLGFIINGEGIRADDKGIEAIQNFPIPD